MLPKNKSALQAADKGVDSDTKQGYTSTAYMQHQALFVTMIKQKNDWIRVARR
jgi:hypothetical protein